MMNFARRNLTLAVVFSTGAAILIVEVVATRILSPYFGNTIFTFSSVIGIILAALSCGYYIGGILADRKPTQSRFYSLILLGGISVLLLKLAMLFILPKLGYSLSMIQGPLVLSLILFFLPGLLLGTLSPFAIKLQHVMMPEEGVGRVSGLVFFWSTVGSIVGSLSAGFWLIPHFGVSAIITTVGVFLVSLGGLGLLITGKRKIITAVNIFFVGLTFAFFNFIIPHGIASNILYHKDGYYEHIAIKDGIYKKRPMRMLMQDLSTNSGMYLDTGLMVFDYTKYYELYRIFTPEPKHALAIGGGAYSVPKELLTAQPEIVIDVAEIEPSLYSLAKQYFGLTPSPQINNYIDDGRRFLHDTTENYDLIFSDVYFSFASVPMHCTTKEFFQLADDKLTPNGIFIANFVGSLSKNARPLILSVIKTMKDVFPQLYVFAIINPNSEIPQNFILVGHNSEDSTVLQRADLSQFTNPILRDLKSKQLQIGQLDLSPYPVLTDDYAPVEYLSAQVIRRYNKIIRKQSLPTL